MSTTTPSLAAIMEHLDVYQLTWTQFFKLLNVLSTAQPENDLPLVSNHSAFADL
jgi:hypothetical protein